MKNHWVVAIGINQYQFFQPLNYAQQDAEGLYDFFVEDAGLGTDHCWLLTDSSQPIAGDTTNPTRANILQTLDRVCEERVEAGDILWCFFSGYGVSYEGQDYLMPIEGNPAEILETGIAMRSLFDRLKASATNNLLVLLDMNRAFGLRAGETIGAQTAELARSLEIPTILACQPGQFSRETSALQHGFFTAGVLEALRYHDCRTLESLNRILSDRVPALSEHHWRPKQEPLMVANPLEKMQQPILFVTPSTVMANSQNGVAVLNAPEDSRTGSTPTLLVPPPIPAPPPEPTGPAPGEETASLVTEPTQPVAPTQPVTPTQPLTGDVPPRKEPEKAPSEIPFWLQFLLTLGVLALALLFGVWLSNKGRFVGNQATTPTPTLAPVVPPVINSDPVLPSPPASPTPTASIIPAASPTPPAASPTPTAPPPPPAPVQTSQGLLTKARAELVSNQASGFSNAIREARKIKAGDPLYNQAQQDIQRWSQVMLDLAVGRAEKQNYAAAIAAAQLVPKDLPTHYSQAQQAILEWQKLRQKEQQNEIALLSARGLIREGQASSYNRAIDAAREIAPGQPQYQQAQQLIGQWSQQILEIAKTRAARRNYQEAMAAAVLVPPDTPAYPAAQQAIAKWMNQVPKR